MRGWKYFSVAKLKQKRIKLKITRPSICTGRNRKNHFGDKSVGLGKDVRRDYKWISLRSLSSKLIK